MSGQFILLRKAGGGHVSVRPEEIVMVTSSGEDECAFWLRGQQQFHRAQESALSVISKIERHTTGGKR